MINGWQHLSNPADSVFFLVVAISVVLLGLNTAVMVYFVFRYRRKRHPQAEEVRDSTTLEIVWTVVPTILVLVIFFAGWKGFQYMRTVPPDALQIKVTARQWSWTFDYDNGKQDSVLRVPAGKPVKLLLTSADVLHSLFIPAYRIKEDCVPGRQTYLWFRPDEPGSYDLFCTEYCGVGHSGMITKVEVMKEPDFNAWYRGEKQAAQKTAGKQAPHHEEKDAAKLIQLKGCIACHSTDGTTKVGPSFKGVFGRKETVVHDGKEREITVDEGFIRQTLLQPEIDRVKGFPPIMPSQKGQLNDHEIAEIIEYLKELK